MSDFVSSLTKLLQRTGKSMQGKINCGASSQAVFIQNYFLQKNLFWKLNFLKKYFWHKDAIFSPFWVECSLPFPLFVSTPSQPGYQATKICATLSLWQLQIFEMIKTSPLLYRIIKYLFSRLHGLQLELLPLNIFSLLHLLHLHVLPVEHEHIVRSERHVHPDLQGWRGGGA